MPRTMTADLGRQYLLQCYDELAHAVCHKRQADADAYRNRIGHLKGLIKKCEEHEAREKARKSVVSCE